MQTVFLILSCVAVECFSPGLAVWPGALSCIVPEDYALDMRCNAIGPGVKDKTRFFSLRFDETRKLNLR